jgi:hypothetical protein
LCSGPRTALTIHFALQLALTLSLLLRFRRDAGLLVGNARAALPGLVFNAARRNRDCADRQHKWQQSAHDSRACLGIAKTQPALEARTGAFTEITGDLTLLVAELGAFGRPALRLLGGRNPIAPRHHRILGGRAGAGQQTKPQGRSQCKTGQNTSPQKSAKDMPRISHAPFMFQWSDDLKSNRVVPTSVTAVGPRGSMVNIVQFLRDEANRFRDVARFDKDPNVRRRLAALAKQCDDAAAEIEGGPSYKRTISR